MGSAGADRKKISNSKNGQNPNGLVLVQKTNLPGGAGASHNAVKPMLTQKEMQFLDIIADIFFTSIKKIQL